MHHLVATPCARAAKYGQLDMCKLLLSYTSKNSLEKPNFEGWSPLCCAIAYGHVEVAELMLQSGCNPHYTTAGAGNTLLHVAAWYGCAASVEWLLNANLPDLDVTAENQVRAQQRSCCSS